MNLLSDYVVTFIDTLWPLVFVTVISALFYVFREPIRNSKWRLFIPYTLFVVLVIFEYGLFTGMVLGAMESFKDFIGAIPMHLCSMSVILIMLYVIFRKDWIFNIVIIQGIVGSLVTFAFPDITQSPAEYYYWKFFFSHTILFLLPVYYFIIEKKKITIMTLKLASLALVVFGVFAIGINTYAGKNYMYISSNNSENLFAFLPVHQAIPFLATWPGVLLFGAILAVVAYGAIYFLLRLAQKAIN